MCFDLFDVPLTYEGACLLHCVDWACFMHLDEPQAIQGPSILGSSTTVQRSIF
jgi:hypothetical protein